MFSIWTLTFCHAINYIGAADFEFKDGSIIVVWFDESVLDWTPEFFARWAAATSVAIAEFRSFEKGRRFVTEAAAFLRHCGRRDLSDRTIYDFDAFVEDNIGPSYDI